MMYKDERIIGRIREIMKERNINQKALESDTGIVQSSISQMLGLHRSALPLIEAMSKVYGVNREWLLTGLGEKYGLIPIGRSSRHGELSDGERLLLVKELNTLHFRHQDLMNESSRIMEIVAKVNSRLMYGEEFTI